MSYYNEVLFYFLTYNWLNNDYEPDQVHSQIVNISFHLLKIIYYGILLNDVYGICCIFSKISIFNIKFVMMINYIISYIAKDRLFKLMNRSQKFVFVRYYLFLTESILNLQQIYLMFPPTTIFFLIQKLSSFYYYLDQRNKYISFMFFYF